MSALAASAAPPRGRLQDLIALASEPSSARRRELLREVTDLFFAAEAPQGVEAALFDEVLTRLSAEMEAEVQTELARRMAVCARAPKTLVRTLARGEVAIAKPLLEGGPALGPEDLQDIVATSPQEHLRLVSSRPDITPALSDAIIHRADDATLEVLIRNDRAELSRAGNETVVSRALENSALHAAVVGRKSLPLDLLNELYFVVEAQLRQTIARRNADVDPQTLEAALAAGRRRVAQRDGAFPEDYAEAERYVAGLRRSGALTPTALVGLLRSGARTRFLAALAELADLDFHTARRIIEGADLDALAIVCKAADFERAIFITFAVMIGGDEGMGRAHEYGRLFGELPKDTALRTMRFWRMRRVSGDIARA